MQNFNGKSLCEMIVSIEVFFCDSFTENLQKEVLEIEFSEFSHGFKTISDLDFAEILLRYTDLDRDRKRTILKKVRRFSDTPNVRDQQRIKSLLSHRSSVILGNYIRRIRTILFLSEQSGRIQHCHAFPSIVQ